MHLSISKSYLLFLAVSLVYVKVSGQQTDTTQTNVTRVGTETIVIVTKQPQKTVSVTGLITDAATNKPLQGITVRYKNISAAITDPTGYFSLKVPDYSVVVIIEGETYQAKEIALKGRSNVSTRLYEDIYASLYDQANLPTGRQSQNQVAEAVTSVYTQGSWDRSFETPDAYLQGRVAGLHAIRLSGTPNIGANLFLRGYNSLYATNQPLIVVDGVIYDNTEYGSSLISNHYNNPLAHIDIKDIDNITVIKDGSSLYGTKGGNGVIMITTARAKELATRIDFAVYGGINLRPAKLPLLNASGYRTYLSQVLQTSGMSDAQIQAFPFMNDDTNDPEYYRYHYNTNWQKQVLKNSYARNIYLKVTGGDNIAKYALSLGYMKNEGVISTTGLTRYNTRFNADFNLSKRLTATANLSFSFNEQNLKDQGMAPKTNPLYLSLIKAPILPVYAVSDAGIESPDIADTDLFNVSNPQAVINNMTATNKNYRFFGSLGFDYRFSGALNLTTNVGITIDKVRESIFIPGKGIVNDTLSNAIVDNRSGSQVKRLFMLFNDTRLSYNKTFNRIHALNAAIGLRFISHKTEKDFGLGYNSATDELVSVGNGVSTLRRISGNLGEYRWLNNYLTARYSLSDKYFFTVNMSVDGSSRFGKNITNGAVQLNGNSFAVMPSLAWAWLVSSENFMASSGIELLKLRASVGLSGNDDIGNYTSRQTYVSQNLLGIQGLVRSGFGNAGLQWENVRKINAGLDLAIFNERVNISLDVYGNQTGKMLINEPLASATGLQLAVTNTGGMKTKGIEANINTRLINQPFLKWDLGLNIAHYKTMITRLPVERLLTMYGGATIISRVNDVPNLFYGHRTNGVFSTNAEALQAGDSLKTITGSRVAFKGGDMRFTDMNGDNIIDDNDREVIGDPNPDFYGAITSSVKWKKWSMNVLFTFSHGNEIYNYVRNQLESVSGYNNQTPAILNSWRKEGDVSVFPKATWGDSMGNSRFSDRWIEDGSYFRLRTLSISYDLPLVNRFLKYAVVYLTGNNVFTLTRYLGYDPEFSSIQSALGQGIDIAVEPQYRSVQVGVWFGL